MKSQQTSSPLFDFKNLDKTSIFTIAIIFIILYLWHLGLYPLINPDEGRYAEIPREMLANKNFITPYLNGVEYFEKPALQYWITAFFMYIFGENEFAEKCEDADIVDRLGFGKCRLSLAIPKIIDYTGVEWFNGKKIATSYPAILRKYLEKKDIKADIHVITGSVEISPGIGLADGIFDIVSSGSTLVSNNLREVEIVMESEAVLIANKSLTPEKRGILDRMLFRIKAVRNAEDKKYVRMNVPKARLDEIINVLPGLKSPTIIPLADNEWCSVHTVLDEARFWEIIGKLKELGAQGILVTPIEKMIL